MKITTTHKARRLLAFTQLPKAAQSDFDYLKESEHHTERFVKYRNAWYDAHDTQRIALDTGAPVGWAMVVKTDNVLSKWHAVISETFFSGVLFRFVDDGQVICASYSD